MITEATIKECHEQAKKNGFWEIVSITEAMQKHLSLSDGDQLDTHILLAKLALIDSEIGEAVEAVRRGNIFDNPNTDESLEMELADIVIRIFDLAGYLEMDLINTILQKMEKNRDRPLRHGKKA